MKWLVSLFTVLIATMVQSLEARDFYVSPHGRPTGSGSLERPWDLATALAHPNSVGPGDRILLREGVYRGSFRSMLAGTASAPIVVRPYQNERAVLDGASQARTDVPMYSALTVVGPHTWYWGFEITNTESNRMFPEPGSQCWERQHCRGGAVEVFGVGVKIINLVIHDTGGGIGLWTPAVGAEAYGNIIYYVGWQGTYGAGHALYLQNDSGTKHIVDNVMFSGFHSGVHFYGSGRSSLRNVKFEGNTIFNTGVLAEDPHGWGILIGGGTVADNITVVDNILYNPEWLRRSNNLNPSYGLGADRVLLEGNYSVGYRALEADAPPHRLQATGNSFFGSVSPSLAGLVREQPGNTIGSSESMTGKPNRIFIRRNKYEPEKAIVTVFNWQGSSDVELDLSSLLQPGDSYEIIDVQNYFGPPARSGVFDGQPISVPMLSGSGSPVGSVPGDRFRTGPEFGVFQVRVQPAAGQANGILRVRPERLRFTVAEAGQAPAAQTLFVSSASAERASWQASSNAPWIRLARPDLPDAERLFVSVDAIGMDPGSYATEILLTPENDRARSVPVSLRVADAAMAPSIDAVSNAASRFPALAAETLFAIHGSNLSQEEHLAPPGEQLPTELGGTTVRVAGAPAYLVEVSPTRILAVAPKPVREVLDSAGVELVVETNIAVASAIVPAIPVSVGIWEWDTPPGHVIAGQADGTVVSAQSESPARSGDHLSFYVTGLRTSKRDWAPPFAGPGSAYGHLEVLFGDVPGIVTYAGATQPGVAQVNVVVPALPAGRHSVVLRYRKTTTQPSAYLPIAE